MVRRLNPEVPTASVVHRVLRAAGFAPGHSGEGANAIGLFCTQGPSEVTVVARFRSDDECERMAASARTALLEAGWTCTEPRGNARQLFWVTAKPGASA